MKNKYILTAILMSLFLVVTGITSCSSGKITASPGEQFTLPLGKTATIDGENLSIKFTDVTADSRCPRGVECIWAGEAKCQVLVTSGGTERDMVFTQPGSSTGEESLNQYKFSFTLEPYPEANKQIAKDEYKLIMTVTK